MTLIDDYYAEMISDSLKEFCDLYGFITFIGAPTCFGGAGSGNPGSIGVTLLWAVGVHGLRTHNNRVRAGLRGIFSG